MLNTTKRILITLPTLLFPCLALADDKIEFNRHVLPILSNHCYVCHGPDAATREAGLRLDQRDSATGKADSGKSAITPGDVQASELIRRITTNDPDERMPPAEGHKPLNASQIAILKAWIKQGAGFQQHWAFVAPKQPKIPQPKNRRWPKNNIDHFICSVIYKCTMIISPTCFIG